MFKFRSGGQGGSSPTQPPTIESVRRRARQRLLGSVVLVFAGVVGFPLLFESQPRQVPVDFEVEIPARKNAKSLVPDAPAPGVRIEGLDASEEMIATPETPKPVEAASAVPVVAGAAAVATVAAVAATAAALPATQPPAQPPSQSQSQASAPMPVPLRPKVEVAPPKPVEPKSVEAPKPETKLADKPAPKPVEKDKPADNKPAPKPAGEAARALALLEDKPGQSSKSVDPDKASAAGRHVVQVGAFADPEKAREVRQKIEQAGLPTYTHVADTPDGKRTRVRLGPFATRAEAEKTAAKLRTLGLSSAIFSL